MLRMLEIELGRAPDICKKLIDVASVAGCDYVKIQKRTPEICVPENQKNKIQTIK